MGTKSKDRLRAGLKILGVSRALESVVRLGLRDHGTTLARFDVMSVLDRYRDGLIMSQVSAKLRISNGNVTGIIDRLVGDGLVYRDERDGDRRATIVKLTPEGQRRFAVMAQAHEAWIDNSLSSLSREDVNDLKRILAKIISANETGSSL